MTFSNKDISTAGRQAADYSHVFKKHVKYICEIKKKPIINLDKYQLTPIFRHLFL